MRLSIFLIGFLAISTSKIQAQCQHNPTISPNNLILCPNEWDTLWTQTYDSYQWYKDGNLIPGATNQFLIVDYFNYAGTNISVDATLSGCSELSPEVLVDGWVFLPPFVVNGGTYTLNGQVFEVCTNDTITFELGLPYETNIQWTADGVDLIGENNALIEITSSISSGVVNYNVCGSPNACPNLIECLGVPLNVQFIECGSTGIVEPEITFNIYPNPVNDFFIIENNSDLLDLKYSLSDQMGRKVLEGYLSSNLTEIDASRLSNGIYFINILGAISFKIMKQ